MQAKKQNMLFFLFILFFINIRAKEFTVINVKDEGLGSLRQAIIDANNDSNVPHLIKFNIPGSQVHTIIVGASTNAPLPKITRSTIIDGYTQSGAKSNTAKFASNAKIKIVLNGKLRPVDQTSGTGWGLFLAADSCEVRGLAINGFIPPNPFINYDGIFVASQKNKIQGNFLGVNASGTKTIRNDVSILVDNEHNLIGGDERANRNIIAGNVIRRVGSIVIQSDNNVIKNNFIGLNKTGKKIAGQTSVGITLASCQNNIIMNNVISGCSQIAILLSQTNNVIVRDNLIGTDAKGQKLLMQNGRGIFLINDCLNSVIDKNVIVGSAHAGVELGTSFFPGAVNTGITGNKIGVSRCGDKILPNEWGIYIAGLNDKNKIGGSDAHEKNIISGNKKDGIRITAQATGTVVDGNQIGIAAHRPTPNKLSGIQIGTALSAASGNQIGNNQSQQSNKIAYNSKNGVRIVDSSFSNTIVNNSIANNGRSGIKLTCKTDNSTEGPNHLQASPKLKTAKIIANKTIISGVLQSSANTFFEIQFFENEVNRNSQCITEGKCLLGSLRITTNNSGFVKFSAITRKANKPFISATATKIENDLLTDTSEFSKNIAKKS